MIKTKFINLAVVLIFFCAVPKVANAALIAYWDFNEASGTIASDSVGGVNGTLSGAASFDPTGGILGGAVQGPNADVSMGDNFMFGSVDFSVQAWIKTTPGFAAAGGPIWKHLGGSHNGYFLAVNNVGDGAGGAGGFAHFYASGGKTGLSSTVVNDGTWHQLVGVYDVTGNETRLYVDGVHENTGPRPPMVSNTQPFLVNVGDGHVDEVGIWNHALSDSEVSALYQNATSPVPEPATIALLGIDLAGFAGAAVRRKAKKRHSNNTSL
ncbi:MAG: PEP-CTERM sorting domain-containing protein [Candidatus Scalindua rubra]|uniref:Ice-binding protein C-terminal domain-containing protein n=1 Tax=Candidatus Scalindua brodae TaxID=237368 RepID=A0A0B0EMG8_9BACT|nr:MAG: hypothetical protein SCABRO_00978 [Candidatus Scalindua brodae]MBZ0107918.1 PEP-CTERM sorting domain-containing protein [Candidatus Scalindua rubra]TWU31034.1 hypothetical protein S225a_22560 [Candidatus Brocadiaceae bacterium S225]